jgi:carboxylesterase type B
MTYAYPEDPIVSALMIVSGTVEGLNAHPDDDAEFVRVARTVGCASQDRKQELECMRTVDAARLKHAISNETFNEFSGYNGGWPTADNVTFFTKEEAGRRGQAGNFARLVCTVP